MCEAQNDTGAGKVGSPALAEILGIPRRTVSSYAKRGVLSAEKDADGHYLFDPATAEREYRRHVRLRHGLAPGEGSASVGLRYRERFERDGVTVAESMDVTAGGFLACDSDFERERIIAGLTGARPSSALEPDEAGRLIILWQLRHAGFCKETDPAKTWPYSRLPTLSEEEAAEVAVDTGRTPYQLFTDFVGEDGADAVEYDERLHKMLRDAGLGDFIAFAKAGETMPGHRDLPRSRPVGRNEGLSAYERGCGCRDDGDGPTAPQNEEFGIPLGDSAPALALDPDFERDVNEMLEGLDFPDEG